MDYAPGLRDPISWFLIIGFLFAVFMAWKTTREEAKRKKRVDFSHRRK